MFTATTFTQTPLVNARLSQLTKSKRKHVNENGDFYVLVGNTGGEVNLSNSDEAETMRIFRRGSCLVFAYATSLVTGFPVAIFTASEPNEAWAGHAAVQLPTGEFFDIAGVTTQGEIRRYFGLSGAEPVIFETPEAAHAIFKDSIGDNGAFSYLLGQINELGLLVTFHFVEQLLSFYDIPFDVDHLREMEKKTVAYARKASRESKSLKR